MPESTQTVGDYEFLGIVDKPKAGVTYKVRNLTTGEFVVLRALPGASYSDPESLERFLREIKIHARLSHPNIVAFHDAFQLDGRLVMTAEFVEGTTLAELCSRGPIPSQQAIQVGCDVLAALEEAHALGVVHRGITAEHVIVQQNGESKLGGFGLAKPASDVSLTRAGAVVGDVGYMSPEQVEGVAALDPRSDLYSVGVLLFYALTGKWALSGANGFDVMLAHVKTPPPRPSSLNPGIELELERIILTALAKKPDERFPGATEFRTALGALIDARQSVNPAAPVDGILGPQAPQLFAQAESAAPRKILYVLGFILVAIILFFLGKR